MSKILHTMKAKKLTPFDQIRALEEMEKKRVETEVAAMQQEEKEVHCATEKKEGETELQLKEEAHKELEQCQKKELQQILTREEAESVSETSDLEKHYKMRKAEVIESLVKQATDPDFLFSHT